MTGVLLCSLAVAAPVHAGSSKGDSGIAAAELERRLEARAAAEQLIAEGQALAVQGNHCGAADKFHEAARLLKQGAAATASVRRDAVRRLATSGVECARESAIRGEFEKAKARLQQILAQDMAPDDKPAQKLLKDLDDPDRFNPALSPANVANVKKASRLLLMGEKYIELGDYRTAQAAYNQVLAIDATNTAARQGLEKVEKLIEEYNTAAQGHTRIKMLTDVDRLWESPVPALAKVKPVASGGTEDVMTGSSSVVAKLRTLVLPRVALTDASISEVVAYLSRKSVEVDVMEPDDSRRGVNIIWTPGSSDAAVRPVTVDLRNVKLGDALRSICEISGTRFQSDGAVVRVSVTGGSTLETRQFRVPPGFLSTSASAVASDAGTGDPFAAGDAAAAKPKLGRLDAKTFLEQQGVAFPEGARAAYNAAQNLLTVTNTPESLDTVGMYIDGLSTAGQKQVMVKVVLLKASEKRLEELGGDFLMESFKAGGGVFASGGSFGNSELGATANSPGNFGSTSFLPVTVPFNVVNGPVTAGLRSSYELTRQQTIDDLIDITNNGGITSTQNRSPFIAGVGGLFTSPRFQALLRGLDQKKGVDLSVANTVIVKSGQRASSFSGRKFSYPTEFDPPQIPQTVASNDQLVIDPLTGQLTIQSNSAGQAPVTPATPNSFQEKDIGSSIEVEAIIGEDGYTVDLNLSVLFSEFDGFINYGTPITGGGTAEVLSDNQIIQPVFSRASANAQVLVYDGQTVAIGGLTQAKSETVEDRVPGLSSIPIVGKFFRTEMERTTRTAVVYFVTVNIVDPSGDRVNAASEINADDASPMDPGSSSLPEFSSEPGLPVNAVE